MSGNKSRLAVTLFFVILLGAVLTCVSVYLFNNNDVYRELFSGAGSSGLGAVGPTGSYADYSVLSKIVLSFAMLLGRLEIYPLVLALLPGTWTKK